VSKVSLLDQRVATAFYGEFSKLRPAQEAAIQPILEGRNIVLSSATGSGKTEAVIAPLISRYLEEAVESDSLVVLYIAPTKALVNDLERRLVIPLHRLGLRLGIRHGDRELRTNNAHHVLITTPESLDVLLFRRDATLANVRAVVVDEVHLLYNTQRGLQLSILLRRLRHRLPHPLQWTALSATVGNQGHVRDFLFGEKEQAEFLQDATFREIDAQIRFLTSLCELKDLFVRLLNTSHGKFLVFANSRRECEEVAAGLTSDKSLSPFVFAHYSSLSTEMREEVEKSFNQAPRAICIATSTLELGIDIGDIDASFLYGPAPGVVSFLQRVGRSNRRSNKTNVVCLVRPGSTQPNLEGLYFQALIELARNRRLSDAPPYKLFGAVGQQVLSYIGSVHGEFTRTADLVEICCHLPYLDRPVVEMILGALAREDYLKHHGFKNQYGAGPKLYDLVDYRLVYGNFAMGSQEIPISFGEKVLGHIPAVNLVRIHSGDVIQFGGRTWLIKRVATEGIVVDRTAGGKQSVEIFFPGSGMGIDESVLSAAWDMMHHGVIDLELYAASDRDRIQALLESVRDLTIGESIPYCLKPEGLTYLTFAGRLVNKAIALISGQSDWKATETKLTCGIPIKWSSIPIKPKEYHTIFDDLFQAGGEQTLYQSLLPEDLQREEFLQKWLNDPIIPVQLERLNRGAPRQILPEQMEAFGF
jgi:ATP-dependent Lhr-like helicase